MPTTQDNTVIGMLRHNHGTATTQTQNPNFTLQECTSQDYNHM